MKNEKRIWQEEEAVMIMVFQLGLASYGWELATLFLLIKEPVKLYCRYPSLDLLFLKFS